MNQQRMLQPKVTVVLPVHNGSQYLDEAVASILKQTFTNFELLIVDDNSTDESGLKARYWQENDRRVRLLRNPQTQGLANALNAGLKKARGTYIARADCDDLYRPQRFALQVEYLDTHPAIALVGSAYQPFNANGKQAPITHPTQPLTIAWKMLANSAFCHPSVMFRRSVLQRIPGYPNTAAEDFAFFSAIVHNWPASNIEEIFVDYREHEGNTSATRRDAIRLSAQETFRKNIIWYVGSGAPVNEFYDYLVRRTLPLNRFGLMVSICIKVSNAIQNRYKLAWWNPRCLAQYLQILFDCSTVAIRTGIGLPPIGEAFEKIPSTPKADR